MTDRNSRRLDKKAEAKRIKAIVNGMNPLQRFVLDGLKKRLITEKEIIEMCQFYLKDKTETLIEFLEENGYKITKPEK